MKQRLFCIFLLLCLLLLNVTPASAADTIASGSCGDNASWTLDSEGTFTVSGSGKMTDFTFDDVSPWEEYIGEIQSVVIGKGITHVGDRSFSNADAIKTVSLPSSLTGIGLLAFSNCTSLTGIDIPANVTFIGTNAFYCCTSMTEVTLGGKLKSVSEYAFYVCNAVTDVYFRGSEAEWEDFDTGHANWVLDDARVHFDADTFTHTYAKKTVKPNCTRSGYTTYTCTCGITYRDLAREAQGHSYEATSVSNGCTTYTCSVCENTYTENNPYYGHVISSNSGKNTYAYNRWSKIYNSYLAEDPNGGYVRVEYTGARVHVELYDKNLQFRGHRELEPELPLFGGYYTDGTHHFLVFGQENPKEYDTTEVIRVVKYSSTWERMDAVSAFGFATTVPFDAGNLRMTDQDGILYIRTSHEMYASSDGKNHQSNLSLHINISDMTLADYYQYGYVSHSFNQFIINDGNYIVKADHGDAYPRSVVLYRDGTQVDVLPIKGSVGNNDTGVKLGGLSHSAKNYLVVGTSIDQESSSTSFSGQQNLFVTVTPKADFTESATKLIWLTSHTGGVTFTTPYLVKISDSSFCVLWTENGTLCYTFLNGSGKITTDIYRKTAFTLSDCQPIYADGAVRWYVTNGSTVKFYSINPDTGKISTSAAYGAGAGPTVTASNIPATGKIKLSWTSVSGAEKYKVFRATEKTGPYKLIKTTEATTLTNTSAEGGKTYYYYVMAVDSNGIISRGGNTVKRTCDCAQPVITVTNNAATGKPRITWAKVEGAEKYAVYRATAKDGTYTRLGYTTGTAFNNTGAEVGKTYYYKVRAISSNSGANSIYSSAKSRTCDLPRPSITLSNNPKTGKINITWEAIPGAVKYSIYRSKDNSSWTKLGSTTGTSFTNTSTEAGHTYYYKVFAVASNSAANSAYSTVKSRTCDLPRPSITLSNDAKTGKIKISWESIPGAVTYSVYRSTDNSSWTKLGSTTGTSFTNTSAEAGHTYYYKVFAAASNSAANSAYSTVKYRTCDLPQPVLSVSLNPSGKPVLTWEEIDGAAKYHIYVSTDNQEWRKLFTTTGTSLIHSSAEAGGTYFYKVFAAASASAANSAYSEVVSITP